MKNTVLMFVCVATLSGASRHAAAQQPPTSAATKTPVARPVSLEGDWAATLQVGETELQLVLHLSRDAQGQWHAKLDSLNQSVFGMEASSVTHEEDALHFEIASVGAKFQGKIQPDHRTIRGVWEQSGSGLPLKFEKRSASGSRAAGLKLTDDTE